MMSVIKNTVGGAFGIYMIFNSACGVVAMSNGNFRNSGEDFGNGFLAGHKIIFDFVGDATKVIGGAAYEGAVDFFANENE